jgi:4,4'-diaponeurosporenoate glycosyltransferase
MGTIILIMAGLICGHLALGRVRHLLPGGGGRQRGQTWTVVIPARNEAATLPLLLGDLLPQLPEGARVVVVDDGSTDGTSAVAASHPGVEVRWVESVPDGWLGKPWACHVGARDAPDGALLFLDADVRLAPGAIDAVGDLLARTGGLVSVQPWHVPGSPVEQLSALFNIISLMGAGAGRSQPRGAFGSLLATTTDAYRRTGGHAAVRHEIVEDLALGRRYREEGLPVAVRVGRPLVSFRMYPQGLRQMVDGWTKNFAVGAGSSSPVVLAAVVAWIGALGTVVLAPVQGTLHWPVAAVCYVSAAAQLFVLSREAGRFSPITALLFPLLILFFFVVFARSLYRTLILRRVPWRGRELDLRRTVARHP